MLLAIAALLLQTQALAFPSGLVLDRDGNVLVADRSVSAGAMTPDHDVATQPDGP